MTPLLKSVNKGCVTSFTKLFALTGKLITMAHSTSTNNVTSKGHNNSTVRLFMVGDVMLGRGVDQILQYHVNPVLHEGWVKDAREYVDLAVKANGPLPENRSIEYIWGDAIKVFEEMKPDVRIINLETSVTDNGEPWPNKGIHYRMHPKNVPVIQSAGVQCCILSNNHVLDWGYTGLNDTLNSMRGAGLKTVGAGHDLVDAEKPAIFDFPSKHCRVLVFGAGSPSAGVPSSWRATKAKSGVHYFDETITSEETERIAQLVKRYKTQRNDLVVFSLHWGGNWGWDPEDSQQEFARRLIDEAQVTHLIPTSVDIVYGHSSHHIKGVEVYNGKLIAYGCGDFLTDYEGIKGGYDTIGFRDDLSLMYFVDLNVSSGNLSQLHFTPMRLKHMQVCRAVGADEQWLFNNMKRECKKYGSSIERSENGQFSLVF